LYIVFSVRARHRRGSEPTLRAVWSFADITNALMVIPNIISLFASSSVMILETRKYLWNGDINASEIPDAKSAAVEE
jgi:Na+/alanine symporter